MKTRPTPLTLAFLTCLAVQATATPHLLAATLTVTTPADSGAGSLHAAIKSARNGDTIMFSLSAPAVITLTSGELLLSKDLNILGPGAGHLAINGNHASRVFRISPRTTVTITGLTIANGVAASGGGIFSDHATLTVSNCFVTGNSATTGIGGGILSDGHIVQGPTVSATLTLSACEVSGNSAYSSGGGIAINGDGGSATATIMNCNVSANSAGSGGGVYSVPGAARITLANCTVSGNSVSQGGGGICHGSAATMMVSNCTVSGNSATPGSGGGIYNFGAMNILNSTVSGNSTYGNGGGVLNLGPGTMTILNSTVFGNSARIYSGGIHNAGASLLIGSTIVYNPGRAGDIVAAVTSLGFNFVGGDPQLGPLQDNGGPTWTHAPLPGSPAIDRGYNFSGLTTDQRGAARTVDSLAVPNPAGGDGTDIGAVETQ